MIFPKILTLNAIISLVIPCLAVTHEVQGENKNDLSEKGILFYASFDKDFDADHARGSGKPWAIRNAKLQKGVRGQGAAIYPMGQISGNRKAFSVLAYDAAGNLCPDYGTIAFWVWSEFDASDRDILTGYGLGGPYVFSISANGIFDAFFAMHRWKSYFGCIFGGYPLEGKLKWFGTAGKTLIPLWKKEQWHHMAICWNSRRGFSVYHNGKVISKIDKSLQWQMLIPEIISLGAPQFSYQGILPPSAKYVFDDLLIMSRPLDDNEVKLVMDGKFEKLRKLDAKDFAVLDGKSRGEFNGIHSAPDFKYDKNGFFLNVIRAGIKEIDINYFRRDRLIDGNVSSQVDFENGEVPFSPEAVFRFFSPESINVIKSDAAKSNNSFVYAVQSKKKLGYLKTGISYLQIPAEKSNSIGIKFGESSIFKELSFFEINQKNDYMDQGTHFYFNSILPESEYKNSGKAILSTYAPSDFPVLQSSKNPGRNSGELKRSAFARNFLTIRPDQDIFIGSLLLKLTLKTEKRQFPVNIKIYDPLLENRVIMDFSFLCSKTDGEDTFTPFTLGLSAPGWIVKADSQLVLEVTLGTEAVLKYGDNYSQAIVFKGNEKDIREQFCNALLRITQPLFERCVGQNKFTNAKLLKNFTLAQEIAPGNERLNSWLCWSGLKKWPQYDFSSLHGQSSPQWALLMREAVNSMSDIIHFWLEKRSSKDFYLVGGGNQWNDITKLYNKFLVLGAIAGDAALINAVEKYLDAHWNSGRMKLGYSAIMTDSLHSTEEASYLQPSLHILKPGVPRHIYRDLLTASNYLFWTGKNKHGHRHFKTSFFTSSKIYEEGVKGRDISMNATVMIPGQRLVWYNGHPPVHEILDEYLAAWSEDSQRKDSGKPAGTIPQAVQFSTDQLFFCFGYQHLIMDLFQNAYSMFNNKCCREILLKILKNRNTHRKWSFYYAPAFLSYRIISGDPTFDSIFREIAKQGFAADLKGIVKNRGQEFIEAQMGLGWVVDRKNTDLERMLKFVIKNNRRAFPIYGPSDIPTDRVFPWGRTILPVLMLGGRLFDARATGPHPSAAFMWTGIDHDLVSLVDEYGQDSLKMRVYNFKQKPLDAGIKLLALPEGDYEITVAPDRNNDFKPDGRASVYTASLRRFTPYRVKFPAGQSIVSLKLKKAAIQENLPDLSITYEGSKGNRYTARIHNLGCANANNIKISLKNRGRTIGEKIIPALAGIQKFTPGYLDIDFPVPTGTDPEACIFVVDPGNTIKEINESNNQYEIRQGIPPKVESEKRKI